MDGDADAEVCFQHVGVFEHIDDVCVPIIFPPNVGIEA